MLSDYCSSVSPDVLTYKQELERMNTIINNIVLYIEGCCKDSETLDEDDINLVKSYVEFAVRSFTKIKSFSDKLVAFVKNEFNDNETIRLLQLKDVYYAGLEQENTDQHKNATKCMLKTLYRIQIMLSCASMKADKLAFVAKVKQ